MAAARKTAVLISGSGSNLQSLIDTRAADPSFPADISLVISNRGDAYGLTRAEKANVPSRVISHRDHADRESFDAAIDAALTEAGIEFVCLAGFMRILTDGFVAKWSSRMLNIHPSLLPAFKGNRAQEQVLASSVALSGATVHAVTADLDGGPIVAQGAIRRDAHDTLTALGERISGVEQRLYPLAVRSFLRDDQAPLPEVPTGDDALFAINPLTRYGGPTAAKG